MTSPEDKHLRDKKRSRNLIAKSLRDQGDHRGAFSLRTINPKKTKYKRKKVDVKDVEQYSEEDD